MDLIVSFPDHCSFFTFHFELLYGGFLLSSVQIFYTEPKL